MRIVSALIAVLALTAVVRPSYCNRYVNQTFPSEPSSPRSSGKFKNLHKKSSEDFIPCCPVVREMVEPEGGKNQDGIFVQLYQDQNHKQRFYEYRCAAGVENKPCRFFNKKLTSACKQTYVYSYALVKNSPDHKKQNFPTFPTQADGTAYVLDYIEVPSGCSCEVIPRRRKKKQKKYYSQKVTNYPS